MGIAPDGAHKPNGTDFWWGPGRQHRQLLVPEHAATSRSPAARDPLPDCNNGQNPEQSVATFDTNPSATAELLACLAAVETGPDPNDPTCDWFRTPPQPTP